MAVKLNNTTCLWSVPYLYTRLLDYAVVGLRWTLGDEYLIDIEHKPATTTYIRSVKNTCLINLTYLTIRCILSTQDIAILYYSIIP